MTTTVGALRVGPADPADEARIATLDGLSVSSARLLGYDLQAADRCCLVATLPAPTTPIPPLAAPTLRATSRTAATSGPGSAPDTVVVGYAAAIVRLGEAHVIDVAVDRAHRRAGIATALLDELDLAALARGARAITLEVAADNLAAQELYRRRGFAVEGRRPAYYPDGQDALIMWRRDPAALEGE